MQPHDKLFRTSMSDMRIVDVGQISDEELKAHRWSGLMEYFAKHIVARDILPYMQEGISLMKKLLEASNTEDYIISVLNYIIKAGEISDEDSFLTMLHQGLPSPVREQAMTIEEMLINKGKRQGIEQGTQQTKYTMAKNLWDITQDYELVARVSNLSIEEVKKLIVQDPTGQKH